MITVQCALKSRNLYLNTLFILPYVLCLVILTLSRDKKRQERRKANFTTSNDTNLDLNSNDNLFVGGIPPESSTK